MTKVSKTHRSITVEFDNGLKLGLGLNKAGDLAGIGAVTAGRTRLRNGELPLYPWIRSVDGYEYIRFRPGRISRRKDGGIEIETRAIGVPRHEQAYGDEYNDHQFHVSRTAAVVEDSLTWILRPAALTLEGLEYQGFSYAWSFASKTQKIYRIVAVGTWELDGHAGGNTILSQGQVTPPVYTATQGTRFTSACLKQLRDFGKPQGMSFQWQPRWGLHQCFDFIASAKGSLLGYWPEKSDVRSFIRKNPGEDVFFVVDAEHWQATTIVTTARKCVLFAPAGKDGLPEHEMRNRWKDAYDYCHALGRSHFGIRRSRPLPESWFGDCGRWAHGKLTMKAGARRVPPQEWLAALADTCFPALAARGIRRIIAQPVSQSDPSERGMECKLQRGIHGDLLVSSVCCTHRYWPAEFWGGIKAWKYFYDKAHALGLEVGIWLGQNLAGAAPIFKEHPDWMIRGFNTLSYAGGYPNFALASINWNTGVRAWILNDLRRWKAEGGIDYIWYDSFANLGMLPLDFSKEMQPNACAIAEFIADLQKIGIANIAIEGMSLFGMGGPAIMDINPATADAAQGIAGQNCWQWYDGNEDMLCDQQPRLELHPARSEEQARQIWFRCLANRCVPVLGRYSQWNGLRRMWFRRYLEAYFTVEKDLVRRRLLPDKRGVLWINGRTRVLFAFRDFSFDLPAGARLERLRGGQPETMSAAGTLNAQAWTVYRFKAGE